MQISNHWKIKAQNNPAVIERCAGDNKRYNIVFRYLRNNDIIIYCVEWDEAVAALQEINGETVES